MSSLRIAHINPSFFPAFSYGGPTESGLETARHLARLGHHVRVLTTDADGRARTTDVNTTAEVAFEARLSVRYCHRIARESISPRLLHELPRLIAWADVVHLTAVYNFTTFPTLLAALLRRKPLIWTPRGALIRWNGGRNRAAKFVWDSAARALLRRPCAIHTTSHREAEQARLRMPGVPVFVAPNGVSCPESPEHVPSDRLRLLALGRLDPIKGLDLLIDALAIVRRRTPLAWELGIVGSGPQPFVDSLKRRVEQHGLTDLIRFEGPLAPDDRASRFAHVDVLVAPSHSENFGMSIAEALAHGVPVIASKGTPWSGLVKHDAGLWVDNSPESLATAIINIATHDRRGMRERGRRWMLDEFSWTRTAEQIAQQFEVMRASSRANGAPS